MLETLATYEMKQASGQNQASKTKQAVVNGKTQAVFSRNSSRCPVFFCTKAPTNHLFAKCVGEEQ